MTIWRCPFCDSTNKAEKEEAARQFLEHVKSFHPEYFLEAWICRNQATYRHAARKRKIPDK